MANLSGVDRLAIAFQMLECFKNAAGTRLVHPSKLKGPQWTAAAVQGYVDYYGDVYKENTND